MTRIIVDPFELNVASETLRSCAVESADIGTELWACAECPMPSDINATVNALVSAADRVLDAAAAQLQVRANDLTNRAAIAANDPVTAATAASSPAASGVWGVIGGMDIVGGTSGPGFAVVGGGDPFGGMSIVGGGGSSFTGTGFSALATTVGGTDPFGGGGIFTGTGFSALGTATVGGGIYTGLGTGSRRDENPVMVLAQTAQNFRDRAQSKIDAIIRNPNSSPAEIQIALNAQGGLGESLSHVIAPSRTELENKYGRMTDGQIDAISPHTLFHPTNLFAGIGGLGFA